MRLHSHYSVWTNALHRKGTGVSPKSCSLLPLSSAVQQVPSSECTSSTIRPCIRASSTAYRSYLSSILHLQFGIVFLPSNCYNICIRSLFLHSLKKNVCPYFDLQKIKFLTSLKKTPIYSDRCLLFYKNRKEWLCERCSTQFEATFLQPYHQRSEKHWDP